MADMDDESDSTSAMSTTRRFKDPIHDYIPLAPEVCAVVDTKHFQRLRNIKQLGTSYYVWPGASHNRFEHCLGVAHLARLMTEHLQKSQPELDITDRDVRCVMLAGLCHDLGHGPWSHVWDSMFIPRALKGKKWKHEDASEMMFDDMIRQYNLGISEQDATFIKALIAGDKTRCADTLEKPFLFEIVANKRNGIDVDKFDYIARDSNAIGERGNLSLSRLIDSSRVVDNEICFDIKDANQVYELCYTRFSLHKRIYHHKTARAIEFMIIDALLAADPYMQIAQCIEQPSEYISLTDDIMPFIERTKDPELAESRAIFTRIRERDLYKCVDYKVFEWGTHDFLEEEVTAAAIVREAKQLDAVAARASQSKDIDALQARDVIVSLSLMHHGMGEDNPLDSVKFYSKRNLNRSQYAGRGDLSTLMPARFGEVLLRVYTKNIRYIGIVQAGYRSLMQQLGEREAAAAALIAASVPPSPTIAATERELPSTPSTPPRPSSKPRKPFSRVASRSGVFPAGAGAGAGGGAGAGSPLESSPSFGEENKFMTVDKDYGRRVLPVPGSPTREGGGGGVGAGGGAERMLRSGKRAREVEPAKGEKEKEKEQEQEQDRDKDPGPGPDRSPARKRRAV